MTPYFQKISDEEYQKLSETIYKQIGCLLKRKITS